MADPVFGKTWNITTRSRLSGSVVPDSETRLYEKVGKGYKLTVRGVRAGKPYEWGYTAQYDGARCPVYGRPDVDAIEKHKVTDLITIGTFTKRGRTVAEYKRSTSADGKNLMVVASGTRPDGTTYFDVLKYKPAKA